MKLILLIALFILSSSSFANPNRPFMTIKDRLRLEMWIEGIQNKPTQKTQARQPTLLNEELEIALMKL